MRKGAIAGFCFVGVLGAALAADAPSQNWTNYVRIGAYGLGRHDADSIVRDAKADNVFGIEIDNDITGRYESYLDPKEKLAAIKAVAEKAHGAGNKAFVYIAGTECITANADKSAHSVVKDHPEWLQRKLTGEPAVFTSGAAFWISPGDEDVWISPYATDWRKTYMERVRQIAGTGIDGIYVDIPYWMTHFDGWENSWASFDDATVAAFKAKTGLDAKKDLKLGDFGDANFRKWLDFRIDTLTDFMKEIRESARSVNPNIMVIPEIYPGIEEEATRVGSDVYEMYPVVDAIAHEYEFGSGEHMASGRTQQDWFMYQAGMLTFRAFAEGKATWILNYSWDGDKNVDAREAMKNLAMSQVIAGANFWDAPGHSMAGSNDRATRREIFDWIAKNEKVLYDERTPLEGTLGVYFSPKSRDYNAAEFLPSYRGAVVMLLQSHTPFQIVTPRTLESFRGPALLLPNVTELGATEKKHLERYRAEGGSVVALGKTPDGVRHDDPARAYYDAFQKDFAAAAERLPKEWLNQLPGRLPVEIEAPATVAMNFSNVDGKPHLYIANFGGLVPGKVAIPRPASGMILKIPGEFGESLEFLPFLGEKQTIHGKAVDDMVVFTLPSVERGAVVWVPETDAKKP